MRRLSPWLATLFRVVVGVLFLLRGLQRLLGGVGSSVTAVIELLCGGLVAAGAWTAPAALLAAAEVAVSSYLTHRLRLSWPSQDGSEVALLYCVSFLILATRGRT